MPYIRPLNLIWHLEPRHNQGKLSDSKKNDLSQLNQSIVLKTVKILTHFQVTSLKLG